METTIVYWGYIGIMDKNMEIAIMWLHRVQGLGFCGFQGSGFKV